MAIIDLVEANLANIGFLFVIIGFVLAFVAIVLLALKTKGDPNRARGAGILLIGPIPIIFGTDRESVKILVVLAIVLIVVVLAFTFVPFLMMK